MGLDKRRLAETRAPLDQIAGQWDEALTRLRGLVETQERGR
ncbi:hypothetical protein [Solimonas soli]|nr:hypothetical protein [Solimonas soli]